MIGGRTDNPHQHLLRDLAPRVLGAVARRCRDFAAAEDAVQEALLAASTQWPREGLPENPRAWLIQVAARRLSDQLRADFARERREALNLARALPDEHVIPAPDGDDEPERDDTLLLLFMCCHPALTSSAAISLTLRAVGGLTTAEIARAFLVPEATMAQRIVRAKQLIKNSGTPFRMPTEDMLPERLDAVLHVLYLVFNEGYAASSGDSLQRVDLSSEAIRLARVVHHLLPDDTDVAGLLALMLLTDARRAARSGPDGELIPLDQQDRSLWDRRGIEEGIELVTQAFSRGPVGVYPIQAAIAALHDEATSTETTDWSEILALYTELKRISDNPMVTLNYAVAAAMVYGPEAGLEHLTALDADPRLANHHRLAAVRAHLYEMAGDVQAAALCYRAAATRTASIPERNYLLMKAARLLARE